jgi:hypothetical protein
MYNIISRLKDKGVRLFGTEYTLIESMKPNIWTLRAFDESQNHNYIVQTGLTEKEALELILSELANKSEEKDAESKFYNF